MTARELLDRWVEALQILAGDDDNPGPEGRERMRVERAQFMDRYDAELCGHHFTEAADLVDSLLGENEHLTRDWNWWDAATIPGSIAALLREHAAPQPDDAPGATQ